MESCKKNVLFFCYGVFVFFSFQVSDVSSANDTISTNQPLSGRHTLISSGDVFELGFFKPSDSSAWRIGMWYKQVSPRTIVWVAYRDYFSGTSYPSECFLNISNGNLIVYDNYTHTTIWSTSIKSSRSKDVRAVLLDNGNLVLRDGPTSSAAVLWQSFDHPTDTWLPDAKFKVGSHFLTSWKALEDPTLGRYTLEVGPMTNNSLITVWNRSKSYWSSRPWDAQLKILEGGPGNLSFELNLDESYITYSTNLSFTHHLLMDVSGKFILRFISDNINSWTTSWSRPENQCAVYNYCGSFGICDEYEYQRCRCVPGFEQESWGSDSDFSDGCIRETELQCDKKKNSFHSIENMKLASDPTTLVMTPNLVTTCASACLANCSCKAYAYDGNNCLMWTTNHVFNLQQLNLNEGHPFFLRVAHSNQGKTKGRIIVLLVVLLSAVFLVGFYCVFSRIRSKRTKRGEKQSRDILGDIIDDGREHMCNLNLHDIMTATNAFSEESKLGEGGFGPVYKGKLPNGMDVAIKRLSRKSSQGLTEFKNEVVLIIKLQHKNLVRLLGYCVEGEEKLLIYEYLSNKSLDVLLFDSEKGRELDWEMRMNIVNGTTRGLQYLHEDSRLRIIHRDLKASNILLDDEMNPKISDFGTARIFGCKQIDDNTQRIVGTFGYMSPEYALGGVISEKSDIYSYGVLLMEIISGKKATRFVHNDQTHSLIAFAWESWCETKGISIIDEALCGSYSSKEVMRCVHIALLCVQDHPNDRPTISQIVYMLSNDNTLPIPKQPTFSNVLNGNQQLVPSDYVFSINEVTQTELEAR